MGKQSSNPRYAANYSARSKLRKRIKSLGLPCALCGKPIDYSLGFIQDPVTGRRRMHQMAYVLDERLPVSLGGSPIDPDNVQPAHWICNARKGNRVTPPSSYRDPRALPRPFDDW